MSENPSELEKLLKSLTENKDKEKKNNKLRHIPDNEFGHKEGLITDDFTDDIDNLSDLINKNTPLANIDDDVKLMIMATIFRLTITPFYQMYNREQDPNVKQALKDIFIFLFAPYNQELKLTRAKGALERQLQAHSKVKRKKDGGYSIENIAEASQQEGSDSFYA